jgi:outer membrane lipoprotein SlyB
VTGATAGGLAGAQMGTGPTSAFTALGGSLIGGLAGTAAEHIAADTKAYEYIVRKASNNELVSVTQKDATPLRLHMKVLVIAGAQARVVPDYTVVGQTETASAKPAPIEAKPTPAEPKAGPAPVQASPLHSADPLPIPGQPIQLVPPSLEHSVAQPAPAPKADPAL